MSHESLPAVDGAYRYCPRVDQTEATTPREDLISMAVRAHDLLRFDFDRWHPLEQQFSTLTADGVDRLGPYGHMRQAVLEILRLIVGSFVAAEHVMNIANDSGITIDRAIEEFYAEEARRRKVGL